MIVPPGLFLAVRAVTNFPVDAERFTARALLVPFPTRSVVVLAGERLAVALDTNFPVLALRLTVRPMIGLLRSYGEVQVGPPRLLLDTASGRGDRDSDNDGLGADAHAADVCHV